MKKLLIVILFILFQSWSTYADDVKAVGYDGALLLPEDARPNDATISLFEERKEIFINRRKMQGQLYTIEPKGNAVEFNFDKNLSSSTLEKELSEGFILVIYIMKMV